MCVKRWEWADMNDAEKILALADRIDHEQLWRRPGMEHQDFTPEQHDRLMAGVYLRRYSDDRFSVLEALKEGKEFMRGYKFTQADNCGTDRRGCGTHEWHVAINRFSDDQRKKSQPWPGFMYTAQRAANEVPRMILQFESERRGLATHFKMCAHDPSPAVAMPDNHLRCALSVACRSCPYLLAIEANTAMTNEAKDEAKAWTCATHILLESNLDSYIETFLHDKSDALFEQRMAQSFGAIFNE